VLCCQSATGWEPLGYAEHDITPHCTRENSLLFLLLMLGTLWLATTLYNFNQTPYLQVEREPL
jgi:hypothetical protein